MTGDRGVLSDRSVDDVMRTYTAHLAQRSEDACGRFSDAADREALHDLRVNVRRLEILLRAFRPRGSSSEKLRASLKKLLKRSNKARDAEVMLDWLVVQEVDPALEVRLGVDWLIARMKRRREKAAIGMHDELVRRWRVAAQRIEKMNKRRRYPGSLSFGDAIGGLIVGYCDRLTGHIRDLDRRRSDTAFHKTRLEIKKLRYLLEPLEAQSAEARTAIIELKKAQDAFGVLNDAANAIDMLGDCIERAAATHARRMVAMMLANNGNGAAADEGIADPAAGLKELLRHALARKRALLDVVTHQYMDGSLSTLVAGVRRFGMALQRRTSVHASPEDTAVARIA